MLGLPAVGDVFAGRFLGEEAAADGGMGTIFRALDQASGQARGEEG